MKLSQLKQLNPHEVSIFVDLDGVMYDFHKRAVQVSGISPDSTVSNPKLRNDFWKLIGAYCKRGGKFFEEMDLLPDAKSLWNFVSKYNPTILTASGHIGDGRDGKRAAVRRDFGVEVSNRMILVRTSADKAQYATPISVLIDDSRKSVDPWVAAGGIGILHKNAYDTIEQLREVGL